MYGKFHFMELRPNTFKDWLWFHKLLLKKQGFWGSKQEVYRVGCRVQLSFPANLLTHVEEQHNIYWVFLFRALAL